MLALLVLVACKQAWLSLVGGTLASSEGEGALHNLGIIFPIINAGRFLGCSAQMKESETLEKNFHRLGRGCRSRKSQNIGIAWMGGGLTLAWIFVKDLST